MNTKRFHHIFDISNCNEKIRDKASLEELVRLVAKTVNMSILAGPIVAEGIPENPGFSAFAIVDFSHISIHTFTAPNEALVDVFSCKTFDRETLEHVVLDFLKTSASEVRHKEVWWGE